jgi:hypothetical protein
MELVGIIRVQGTIPGTCGAIILFFSKFFEFSSSSITE